MARKNKIRTDFRKEHQVRRRKNDLTRKFAQDERADDKTLKSERLTGKGDLTRKRTIVGV
jgi:ribosome biogenesis GTPase